MENRSNERWHGAHHYSNKTHLLLIIFLFFTAATLFWAYFKLHDAKISNIDNAIPTLAPISPTAPNQDDQVACTQEAMLCPDGSFVGRTGPNCEFAPCP